MLGEDTDSESLLENKQSMIAIRLKDHKGAFLSNDISAQHDHSVASIKENAKT